MLRPAPQALSETHTLLREARAPFQSAVPLLRRIPSTVPSALRLTAAARPELPRLTAGLRASLDPLRVLGDRGCDVLGWASNWASMLSWGVGGGGPIGPLNVFRLELIGNNQSIGGLSSAPGPAHGDNPYPAPCTAGKETAP